MNSMQCFSSTHSLSNSSKDSKQMFLNRKEPLIPSNYHTHHHPQHQQNVHQIQNYPCVHPHHPVLSATCSPSISSNSINIWTTINNPTGVKQTSEKIPHYSKIPTLARLNNKNDENHKSIRWRTNEKKFCFLLLIIGCILTFVLLIFSLIFYFLIFKQGNNFGLDLPDRDSSNLLITDNLNFKSDNIQSPSFLSEKIKQSKSKKRKRLTKQIEGELRIVNKSYKEKNVDEEVALIKQNLEYFLIKNLKLCLNNTQVTQYRRGDNLNLKGIIVNFLFNFNCPMANLAKNLAFYFRKYYKSELSIDLRTLRLKPIFDDRNVEYIEVADNENESWQKFGKDSEWANWSEWSACDCANGLVVRSRERFCLNKITNKSGFEFFCGSSDDENDEHMPSIEIKNCDCEETLNHEQITNLAICKNCEKNNKICLSYNGQTPTCLKILNSKEMCGGYCNLKKDKCKFIEESNMHQCTQIESVDGNACLSDEFRCANTICIPSIKYCDGHFNCYDYSDEYNCQCDIASGEYMHCGNSTSCIHISKRCNEIDDCWDRSDEKNCFLNCPFDDDKNSDQVFHCVSIDKECIPIEKHCDGYRDCKDGSDELECTSKDINGKQ